jgi:hypothetical protein
MIAIDATSVAQQVWGHLPDDGASMLSNLATASDPNEWITHYLLDVNLLRTVPINQSYHTEHRLHSTTK